MSFITHGDGIIIVHQYRSTSLSPFPIACQSFTDAHDAHSSLVGLRDIRVMLPPC